MNEPDKQKPNYIALGLIFGAGIGISLGVATDNIAIGMSMGPGIGLVFGVLWTAAARKKSEKGDG